MSTLTIADIQKARTALMKCKTKMQYDEKGRPCYEVYIFGTPEEIESTKRKLMELDEE